MAAAFACAGTALLASPALATTETFNYTGAAQTWTVPAGVTSASFDLFGAQGGLIPSTNSPGLGGHATATIPLTAGDSIQVNVGGRGASFPSSTTGAGGFNGGGNGTGQGGGGASDIRIGGTTVNQRVLVAGGGGGSGNCSSSGQTSNGGGGGGLMGADGFRPPGTAAAPLWRRWRRRDAERRRQRDFTRDHGHLRLRRKRRGRSSPLEVAAAAGMGAGEGYSAELEAAVLALDRPGPASRLGCTRATAR